MSKEFWKSKTFWVNVVALATSVLAAFGLVGELDAAWEPFVVPIIALVNLILRFVTKQPISLR